MLIAPVDEEFIYSIFGGEVFSNLERVRYEILFEFGAEGGGKVGHLLEIEDCFLIKPGSDLLPAQFGPNLLADFFFG